MSRTVTTKLPSRVLPRVSLVEQFTVVAAIGNKAPDAGVQMTAREPSTESTAVAENVTCAPEAPVASLVRSSGIVSSGAPVSRTVTVKSTLAELPA